MKCPRCSSVKTRVLDTREWFEGRTVRRRRQCESCDYRMTTFEQIEESLPLVIKKGGQRESFDRFKILNGIKKACEKRPVGLDQMEQVVKEIEFYLTESAEKEIPSNAIGDLVIAKLRLLDQVAYVRFASVYREFSDVLEFVKTLETLTEIEHYNGNAENHNSNLNSGNENLANYLASNHLPANLINNNSDLKFRRALIKEVPKL